MTCYAIDGVIPVVSPKAYVHPTAVLIGDVIIEEGVYIGPFASLRADFGGIHIKKNANVQDNCVIHGFPNKVTVVEEYGHIGHATILHGCHIGKNVLVGMNSVILDDADIGENTIIGANSTVKAKAVIPAHVLALGSPAKVIRDLEEKEIEWKRKGTQEYIVLVQRCLNTLQEVMPDPQVKTGRLTHEVFGAKHVYKS
ncbi:MULTISPECIES: DapH/DapD/GlmU-related protein [Acinetobacter]|uniref:Gamma carbonic anhydrase family protein n=1 Tax=Acinetobacter piscicola TaxID=2006115 RepID=A0A4Q4H0A3_9GAMM|nr:MULTISPECIES: DapH/DapD/GlmU-related protein [Acinetobacter]MDM1757242.1 gamma carbonic anhydrase family protein [Acinetobacter sp. 256-1]MDM1762515.1 gamma carbonic anhydrase family protein [Acinetobacter sp. 251-1]QOW46139.1 gamma carbonic anhydrase family protein [Acinetobacter piscicola]RYL27256.1 gamma carbonic anhydrase family protein [Acinetobacter piscicola]